VCRRRCRRYPTTYPIELAASDDGSLAVGGVGAAARDSVVGPARGVELAAADEPEEVGHVGFAAADGAVRGRDLADARTHTARDLRE
jgi:hypothetical protein